MANEPLQHLKVLEISESMEVAYGGKLLADYGAEVIKIETPEKGDPARYFGPYKDDNPDPEASGAFLLANTNKKGMTLDITAETGKRIFKSLIKETDILIEGYPPGTMKKWGMDYETLKSLNPGLVMISVTPFGQTGPYRDYKGYPLNFSLAGLQGWVLMVSPKDESLSPIKACGRGHEIGVGQDIVTAALGGVYRKFIDGKGYHIDLSIQESVMTMYTLDLHLSTIGFICDRFNDHRAFMCPIKCKDGHFMLYSFTQAHDWQYIKGMINIPELEEERFNVPNGIAANWMELKEIIEKWAAIYTKNDLLHMCLQNRVAGAPCSKISELFEDTHLAYKNFFVNLPHKKAGTLPYPSVPAKYTRTPARLKTAAPLLGEHNETILAGRLGYGKETIRKLRDTKII